MSLPHCSFKNSSDQTPGLSTHYMLGTHSGAGETMHTASRDMSELIELLCQLGTTQGDTEINGDFPSYTRTGHILVPGPSG